MTLAGRMEKSKLWETARVIMRGSKLEGKIFGHFQVYETLKYQYEGDLLSQDQLTTMGLNKVIVT